MTAEAKSATVALKAFLHQRVYSSEQLLAERRRVTAMLAELFDFYVDHPDRLPPPYDEQAAGEAPHRIVCDYIAGMTDGFFHRTYRRIIENEQ